MNTREIKLLRKSQPTMEGAGVKLNRVFGYYDTPKFDPFLMLDDFRSDNPDDYIKGFPWHPHRGIETITYLVKGSVEHADSLGNKGVIASGDVQWMTAGSGIIHQEMPKMSADRRISGFQLWANLPASHKMMKPRYQDIKSADIPVVTNASGCTVRVVCGSFEGKQGPVTDIITTPVFLDVEVPAETDFMLTTEFADNVFCYVMEGEGYFCERTADETLTQSHNASALHVVLFEGGEQLAVHTKESSLRFLFLSGKPIGEPIAWHGPIVMNTDAEIETALNEYRSGAFIK
jgi:redox-sensitive bicupin YhaK (pirin superfamily)